MEGGGGKGEEDEWRGGGLWAGPDEGGGGRMGMSSERKLASGSSFCEGGRSDRCEGGEGVIQWNLR